MFLDIFSPLLSFLLYKTLTTFGSTPGLARLLPAKRALALARREGTRRSALTMASEPWPPSDVGKRTSRTESRKILPHTMSPGALESRKLPTLVWTRVPSRRPEGAEPGTAGSDWSRASGAWPRK